MEFVDQYGKYFCPTCGKAFNSRMGCVGHQRIHSKKVKHVNAVAYSNNVPAVSSPNNRACGVQSTAQRVSNALLIDALFNCRKKNDSTTGNYYAGLEKVVYNEIPHRLGLIEDRLASLEARSSFVWDWDVVLKFVRVGFAIVGAFVLLKQNKCERFIGWL